VGIPKYLISSLDQSLERMGLEYVDIFYSHRPDPETPLEETMGALDYAVRSGKAVKTGLIAAGSFAGLTAGSAVISSLRHRTGRGRDHS